LNPTSIQRCRRSVRRGCGPPRPAKLLLAFHPPWPWHPADVALDSSFDVAIARVCGLFFWGDGVHVRRADKVGNGDTRPPETGMHLFQRQVDLFRLPVFQHRLQDDSRDFKPLVLVLTVRPLRQWTMFLIFRFHRSSRRDTDRRASQECRVAA